MADTTDKFKKGARRFTTTVGAGGISDASVTTVPLASVTGLPTDTGIEITVDRVDASGNLTLASEEVITGVVSGSNLITCERGTEGTAQAHSAGAVVEVRLTADQWDDVMDGVLVEHEQDGTHSSGIELITPTISGWDQWQSYTGTMPTFSSTTDGVDTLTLTDADDFLQKGAKVEITASTSGTNMYYVSDADSSGFDVNGETSVSGTITAMKYSYADCPFGFKPMSYYSAHLYRSTDYSVATATMSFPNLDTAVFDDSGALAGDGYTVPITGKYNVSLGFRGDSANWLLRVGINDINKERLAWLSSCSGISSSITKELNRGDVINHAVYHTSGSNDNFFGGENDNFLTADFIGV